MERWAVEDGAGGGGKKLHDGIAVVYGGQKLRRKVGMIFGFLILRYARSSRKTLGCSPTAASAMRFWSARSRAIG